MCARTRPLLSCCASHDSFGAAPDAALHVTCAVHAPWGVSYVSYHYGSEQQCCGMDFPRPPVPCCALATISSCFRSLLQETKLPIYGGVSDMTFMAQWDEVRGTADQNDNASTITSSF